MMPTMSQASGTESAQPSFDPPAGDSAPAEVAAQGSGGVLGAEPYEAPAVSSIKSPEFSIGLEELGTLVETKEDVVAGAKKRYEAATSTAQAALEELKAHEEGLTILKLAQAHTGQGGKVTLTLHSVDATS